MRNKHLLLLLSVFLLLCRSAFAQQSDGAISGKVTDEANGEAILFAPLEVTNGVQKRQTSTDEDGNFKITGLVPGKYVLTIQFSGYRAQQIRDITVTGDRTSTVNVKLKSTTVEVKEIEVIVFKKPLFEKDQAVTKTEFTREQLTKSPVKGVGYLAATSSGVTANTNGDLNMRGQRGNGTAIYVDGVKVIGAGATAMPQQAIEQMSVVTGGVPAEYGDATGGFISITTRGPARNYSGGFDAQTSQFLDPFGYNSFEGNYSGPLMKKKYKDREGKDSTWRPLLGFFVSGIFNYSKDGGPTVNGHYILKEDRLKEIQANPLVQIYDPAAPLGYTFRPAAEYVTMDDLMHVKARPNVRNYSYNATGKLDFQPVENFNITLGGSFYYGNRLGSGVSYGEENAAARYSSLFAYDNNAVTTDRNIRTYLRFRQNFVQSKDPNAAIRNAYYTLQFDYQNAFRETYDPDFGDDHFKYGYVGKFNVYTNPDYDDIDSMTITVNGETFTHTGVVQVADKTDSVTFTRGGLNPIYENYTQPYFDFRGNQVKSINEPVTFGNALINGSSAPNVHSLWANVGTRPSGYSKSSTDQFSVNFATTIDTRKHSLKLGVQYDQRVSRAYSTNSAGLWQHARQLVNGHIIQDKANPIVSFDPVSGRYNDTVKYNYITTGNQTYFDKSLRQYLINKGATDAYGRPITETSFIYTDGLTPADLNIGMFSADELLNNGNSYVNYYGYDYKGNVQGKRPSVEDFFTDSLNRRIGAFQPIYMAGFIQDKFEYENITFNVGLRVDRYDANQPVLKDLYSLYPTRTVGELNGQQFAGTGQVYNKPGNVEDDWVPYVNDPKNPTALPIGYRDPNTNRWYDATGREVNDPNTLSYANSGQLVPYLAAGATDENFKDPVKESFKDYEPQVTYMPRVSFSFPISDNAVFFSNYNVLTQRPKAGNQATIDDFYFLNARATGVIQNPNLKPEKRINYEIGFKQKIGATSALTMQAFYGEIRDLIQIQQINFAWPIKYTTYTNIDFGTVKGLTFIYDRRRVASNGVELNANYTLQFANGTGSSEGSQSNLIALGQPNLRTPLPLDYDVRHAFNTTLDYRFGVGNEYTGPQMLDTAGGRNRTFNNVFKGIFENAGFFFVLTARSGTPYSRQSNVTQDVTVGSSQRRILSGDPNSARLPWNFKLDFTFDKNITFKGKTIKDDFGTSRTKESYLNIYLTVQNLLNTANVLGVYRYTGLPNDDAFLSSPLGQQTLAGLYDKSTRQAYIDQYSVKVDNPYNYGAPRIIRLGVRYNF